MIATEDATAYNDGAEGPRATPSTATSAAGELEREELDDGKALPLVDINGALIKQIYQLSRFEYMEFAQSKYMMKESCRMFDSDILESLSKTEWYIIPTLWLPFAAVLFYQGFSLYAAQVASTALLPCVLVWLCGFCLWSFLEYVFHRFIFHFPESSLPQIPFLLVIHFMIHAIHHIFPFDRLRLVLPPALFTIFCLPVLALERNFIRLPSWLMCLTWSGTLVGYVIYDVSHYMFHHFPVEQIQHLGDLKRAHMDHHFKRNDLNFGVSSRFWDRVFRTQIEDQDISKQK